MIARKGPESPPPPRNYCTTTSAALCRDAALPKNLLLLGETSSSRVRAISLPRLLHLVRMLGNDALAKLPAHDSAKIRSGVAAPDPRRWPRYKLRPNRAIIASSSVQCISYLQHAFSPCLPRPGAAHRHGPRLPPQVRRTVLAVTNLARTRDSPLEAQRFTAYTDMDTIPPSRPEEPQPATEDQPPLRTVERPSVLRVGPQRSANRDARHLKSLPYVHASLGS